MRKILFILVMVLMMASCGDLTTSASVQTTRTEQSDKVAQILVEYKIQPAGDAGRCWVDKWLVDGHEYLVFGSGLANPPTVIHNEACPCKEIK